MDEDLKLVEEDTVETVLSAAFGEPVHIKAEDYLGKVIAGCFGHQPHMSGDQRNRLDPRQRRAVDDLAHILAATITRLHAARTADQDTIDGLVKERDKARAEIADLDIQLFTARGKVLTAILRAETAEAQRDAALEALDNLIVVMSLEHARTCAARICDCDLDDTREHSLRSARAASRAIGGGE